MLIQLLTVIFTTLVTLKNSEVDGLVLPHTVAGKQYTSFAPLFATSESGEYISKLLESSSTISKRFFFPGHGGKGPMQTLTTVELLDLPELDETDNLHAPYV